MKLHRVFFPFLSTLDNQKLNQDPGPWEPASLLATLGGRQVCGDHCI